MSDLPSHPDAVRTTIAQRFLDIVEWLGNKLPDPAFLFLISLMITWSVSAWLSQKTFTEIDPRSSEPIRVINQLSATSIVAFMGNMVKTFVEFPPLGMVVVALMGVGVAEQTGFVQAALKALMRLTPRFLLTPMLLFVGILSHVIGDPGYVLVIPLGAVMFQAAKRHPILGITTAFAGVSGGFSASLLPAALDPLLQGFTQKAAQIIAPDIVVNPLCNWGFMSVSCFVIVGVGWFVSDRLIEPRLKRMPIDGDFEMGPNDRTDYAPRTGRVDRGIDSLDYWVDRIDADTVASNVALAATRWQSDGTRIADHEGDRPFDLSVFLDSGCRTWLHRRNHQESSRYRSRNDEVDELDQLLSRHGFFCLAIHRSVHAIECRSSSSDQRSQRPRRTSAPAPTLNPGHHLTHHDRRPADRIGIREMGVAQPHFRPHVDDTGHLGRTDSSRLSYRRFDIEHHLPVDALLPAHRRLLPAIRERDGNRNADIIDVTVLPLFPRFVDGVIDVVLVAQAATRTASDLHLSRVRV